MHLPSNVNGWQACMAVYGISLAARLIWPGLTGIGESHAVFDQIEGGARVIGLLVLGSSLLFAAASLMPANPLETLSTSFGAFLWTTIGLVSTIGEVRSGHIPSLGFFELLGGIGVIAPIVRRVRSMF